MRKFEYDAEDKFFKIDPKFLSKGLDEAEKNKYSSIRVMAMDFRDDKLSLDASDLVGRTWIKRLILDDDLYVAAEESKPHRFGGAHGQTICSPGLFEVQEVKGTGV